MPSGACRPVFGQKITKIEKAVNKTKPCFQLVTLAIALLARLAQSTLTVVTINPEH